MADEPGFSDVSPEEVAAPRPSPMARRHRTKVDFGSILGMAWAVFTKQLGAILAVCVVVMAPIVFASWLMLGSVAGDFGAIDEALGPGGDISEVEWPVGALGVFGATVLLSMIAPFVMQGAITWITVRHLRGEHTSIGAALGVGLQRLLPTLGVAFSVFALALLFMAPALIGLALDSVVLAVLIGGVGAIVAFVVCGLGCWVAVPVCVVERPGVFASLRRSLALTKGYRGWIFLTVFALGMVQGVVSAIFGAMTGGLDPTQQQTFAESFELNWVEQGVGAVFGGFLAVCAASAYYQFRVAKEGFGEDDLARIFD